MRHAERGNPWCAMAVFLWLVLCLWLCSYGWFCVYGCVLVAGPVFMAVLLWLVLYFWQWTRDCALAAVTRGNKEKTGLSR